jgi:hypothetical protein
LFTNGASGLPMTCPYAWFSNTTTMTCAGRGTLAIGGALVADGAGLALTDGLAEPVGALRGGVLELHPARAIATAVAVAATMGTGLMCLVA